MRTAARLVGGESAAVQGLGFCGCELFHVLFVLLLMFVKAKVAGAKGGRHRIEVDK